MIYRIYDKRYMLYAVILFAVILPGCTARVPLPPVEIDVNGTGAVIMDFRTGNVLFEKSPDDRFPPASTTKVMTAIIAIENMPLDAKVVTDDSVLRVEPTIAGLKPGVEYVLGDLLSAILIRSANDAAVAIAEAIAGSEAEFTSMMNRKAAEIGMTDTYFATASGLPAGRPDKQHTTARDLAKMMKYAVRYKDITKRMSMKDAVIYGSDGSRIYLKTHNKALLRTENAPWGKTGYTHEARRTFAGIDPSLDPSITFGLLKSDDLWNDIITLKDKGMLLYERQEKQGFFSRVAEWISSQRMRGRSRSEMIIFENGESED